MNILFVNCSFNMFNGIDSGAANRTTLFVNALTQIGRVDIISFYPEVISSNIKGCDVVYSGWKECNKKNVLCRAFALLRKLVLILINPFCIYNYYSVNRKKEKIVDSFFNNHQYDIVACRYIDDLVGCGLLKYCDRLVVDVDDNPVNALKRDMINMRNVQFLTKWEKRIELKYLGAVVNQILSNVRISFYSNILEQPFPNSIYLHNTTTIEKKIPAIEEGTPKRLLLVGWLDYFPNRNGAIHFVEKIFPKIKSEISDVELHIVGKCKDQCLINRFNQIDGVKALGFVEDIIEEYRNCRVVVVPVYQGSGTSVKFVEGLMMNRPMVSTPMGVRGFEDICKDGEHFLLGEDDADFAQKTISLLLSIEKARLLSQNAFIVGDSHFSQARFFQIVKEAFNNL